jgi:catechol 2,3-dioxygenase-like lactoylglutathione lyase family enzyme
MEVLKLILQSKNLDKTLRFYQEILGFELLFRNRNQVGFRVGSSELVFEKLQDGSSPQYHFAFLIPNQSSELAFQWLNNRGIKILTSEPGPIVNFENWKAKSVYFEDNQGNILELICRADLQNNMIGDFTTQSILGINEVGVVTDSPSEMAEKIIADSGLNYFPKGPKNSDFMVLGEDSGLLVISKKGRHWYPTKMASRLCGLGFEIKVGDKTTWFEFNK